MKKMLVGTLALATVAAAGSASAGLLSFGRILQALGFDSSRPGWFEVYQSPANQQFYFRLKAGNGQKVLASEGYLQKDGAVNGIASLKATASGVYNQVLRAANGKYYFLWRAANYQVTGTSQTYSTASNATRGANTVKAILKRGATVRWVKQ